MIVLVGLALCAAGLAGRAAWRFARRGFELRLPELGTGPIVVLIGVAGAAIEVSYAGRAGAPWSLPTFWCGQVLLYATATYGVTRRSSSDGSTLLILLFVALATYLTKVSYSPLRFTYPDEFQHLRSLDAILAHHHLFYPNPSLPVSPTFPGLEIVTHAVVSITGLSQFGSGLLVAGFAHVVLTVAVFSLFRAVPVSTPVAGLAAIIFATEPHFEYFDAIFAYQTMALPLLCVSFLAVLKLARAASGPEKLRWFLVSLLCTVALLFTHHITMLVFLALLAIFAAVTARRGSWVGAALFILYAGATAAWFATGAHDVLHYLGQPAYENLLGALPGHEAGQQTHGTVTTSPRIDRAWGYASVLCTLGLLVCAWLRTYRARPSVSAATLVFALAALSYPATLAVRLTASDSSELAGRALTFALLAVAVTVAPTLLDIGRRARVRRPLVIAVVTVLMTGGIVSGWPPWWERIPGRFMVASFESGIDKRNLAVALWAQTHLHMNNHVASDFDATALMDTVGRQEGELAVANIFYSPGFTPEIWRQIKSHELRLFVIDLRMQREQPASGGYFALTPPRLVGAGTLPAAGVQKFARSHRFSLIYDNGAILVYALDVARIT